MGKGTHHVGVGRCRGDRRRRRPPPRGGGCRACNDTNTRCTRDGSSPSQSSRARQIAHVHSMSFNLSMQTVRAGPSSRLFRVRRRGPTFSRVSYNRRRRSGFRRPTRFLTITANRDHQPFPPCSAGYRANWNHEPIRPFLPSIFFSFFF